jgi:two-component system sensor histidine kinase BaeS
VSDFQELATSDAGRLVLDLQAFSLRDALQHALGPMADAAGARWRIEGDGDLTVIADENRLRQVVSNLLENSMRHGPSALEIVIRLIRGKGVATFEFQDNGPGVAAADQPHIFERLYRADKSRSRATGGAGLGLAIAKGLVEAMGGTIQYRPGGAGAVFAVSLPMPD